jgi:hypothetical protein
MKDIFKQRKRRNQNLEMKSRLRKLVAFAVGLPEMSQSGLSSTKYLAWYSRVTVVCHLVCRSKDDSS